MVKLGCQGDAEDVTTVQKLNYFPLNPNTVVLLYLHQIVGPRLADQRVTALIQTGGHQQVFIFVEWKRMLITTQLAR